MIGSDFSQTPRQGGAHGVGDLGRFDLADDIA
jgi:hypothetical protein